MHDWAPIQKINSKLVKIFLCNQLLSIKIISSVKAFLGWHLLFTNIFIGKDMIWYDIMYDDLIWLLACMI